MFKINAKAGCRLMGREEETESLIKLYKRPALR